MTRRECGACQLCCRLLPVIDNEPWRKGKPLNKPAGLRCPHQKFGKGCAVYQTSEFPACCAMWTCRWLTGQDTADLSRPDRSHYVIDVMPDFITIQRDADGSRQNIQVVQIWCDPKHPNAHRDPALRAYLSRRAKEGTIGLVRYGTAREALTLIPPEMASDGVWHELDSNVVNVQQEKEHSIHDMMKALSAPARMVFTE